MRGRFFFAKSPPLRFRGKEFSERRSEGERGGKEYVDVWMDGSRRCRKLNGLGDTGSFDIGSGG